MNQLDKSLGEMSCPERPEEPVSARGLRRTLAIERWGRLSYAQALDRQMQAVQARIAGQGRDTLFLVEHPTVVTLGRSFHEENLLVSREALAEKGVEVHSIARGGDVTLHTPGQLVGYLHNSDVRSALGQTRLISRRLSKRDSPQSVIYLSRCTHDTKLNTTSKDVS